MVPVGSALSEISGVEAEVILPEPEDTSPLSVDDVGEGLVGSIRSVHDTTL